ncbi:MAG: hypothetical protein K2K39_03980 [Clostridia bacterium]|nr:hypothetical protein [Clostridia bacterium]
MKRRKSLKFTGLKTSCKITELLDKNDSYCAERYGYLQTDEGLEPSYVTRAHETRVSITNPVYSQELPAVGYTLIVNKNGQMYKWNSGEFATPKGYGVVSGVYPSVVSCVVDGVNAYGVFSGTRVGIIKDGTQVVKTISRKVTGAAYHCGRVFAVDNDNPYIIRWSGYDIVNWTEGIEGGGYLQLSPTLGKAFCVLLVGEKLVILRENGVSVLVALGDSRHFRMQGGSDVFVKGVVDKTAATCGGKLWFFAADGLCCYDGSTVKTTRLNFFGKNYAVEGARVRFGRYIYFPLNDGGVRDILEFDTATGAYAVFGRGCSNPTFLGEGLYCFVGNLLTDLVRGGSDENRVWKSKVLNLGTRRVKTLKNLYVESDSTAEIVIDCDGRLRSVSGAGKIYVGECGTDFTLSVNGNGKITRLAAEWEVHA